MIYEPLNNNPTLITLQGDGDEYDYLRDMMSPPDYNRLMSGDEFDNDDIEYYADAYPELLGVLPIIAKIGAGVGRIVGRIARRIRARRARRRGFSLGPPPPPQPRGPVQGPQPAPGSGAIYNPASGYQGTYPKAPQKPKADNSLLIYSSLAGFAIYVMMRKKKSKKGGK